MKNLLATTLDQNANVQKVSVFGVNYNELKAINQICPLASSSNVNLFKYPESGCLALSCHSPHSVSLSVGVFDDTIISITPVDGQNPAKIISNHAVVFDFKSLIHAENFFWKIYTSSSCFRSFVGDDSLTFCISNDTYMDSIVLNDIRQSVSFDSGGHAFLTVNDGKNTVTIISPCMHVLSE